MTRLSVLRPLALAACAFLTGEAFSKVTGFTDNKGGLSMGAGRYYYWLSNDNAWDPIPSLAPTGTTTTGSDSIQLLPAKLGYFFSRGKLELEPYFRYVLNRRASWTASGSVEGTGYVTFRSYGAGMNVGLSAVEYSRFQLNFVLNAEMVLQRAHLDFVSTGTQDILLTSSSLLAGGGIQPELWLGDLWVLSLLAAYQYGFPRYWSVAKDTNFMGEARSEGELTNSAGAKVPARFGGFLFELALKLNFY